MTFLRLLLTSICTTGLLAGSEQEPMKAPVGAIGAIGPVAFQTFSEGTYFHLGAHGTHLELSTQAPAMAKRLFMILKKAGIQTSGPVLIIQKGATEDPGKPFDQEVGVLVPKGTEAFGEAKVRDLAAFSCATTITSGDFAGEGARPAFLALFKAAAERGRIPTGEFREQILFWEGMGSANNLMQVQIGLR